MVKGMKSDMHILAAIAEHANFGDLGPFASILNGAFAGPKSKPVDRTQIGQGMQLIPADDINSNPKISSKDYCYLYKDGVQVSDMPYRRGGLFSGFGTDKKYCMLIQHPKLRKNPKEGIGNHCIVDLNGNVAMAAETFESSFYYLGGVLCTLKGTIYNLLTGLPIVYGNASSLKSKSFMFVENCYSHCGHEKYEQGVYKIEFATGNFEVFK